MTDAKVVCSHADYCPSNELCFHGREHEFDSGEVSKGTPCTGHFCAALETFVKCEKLSQEQLTT